ncbi:DUF7064 domain-containing protein [Nocardia aurantia]|uniref:Uncharacterized protein n=2 Tax=Nocardia aurantia TaxID=2585199 RepID=A0A7K0DTZ7_9NOCA|nr:hypothetical protein [Nocardia aurantia]
MFAETIGPEHEFRHVPDDTSAYNESTYYNFASAESGVVGWVRVAVQQNRSAAQTSVLIFLPEGRTLVAFGRETDPVPDAFTAGSLTIDIDEPHRRQRITFAGPMSVFDDPRALADPGPALRGAPRVQVRLELSVTGAGVSFGTSGDDPDRVVEKSLALGHYEQFTRLEGTLRVDDRSIAVRGGGLRDHSWGPRDWSGLRYHRWITAVLGDGEAVMALEVGRQDGAVVRTAATTAGGVTAEAQLTDLRVTWTPDGFGREVTCELGPLHLTGTARAPEQFVPLRHVTPGPDGSHAVTRIGYSSYEFTTTDGRHGLGIVEMLDQLVDGMPIGMGTPESR